MSDEGKDSELVILALLLVVASLILPVVLLPIESYLPFPFVIEEIVKLVLVLYLLKIPKLHYRWVLLIVMGFLFSLSESVLYLGTAYSGGYAGLFLEKFVTVFSLHTSTLVILFLPTLKNKKLIYLAFPIAVIVHFVFNGGTAAF